MEVYYMHLVVVVRRVIFGKITSQVFLAYFTEDMKNCLVLYDLESNTNAYPWILIVFGKLYC